MRYHIQSKETGKWVSGVNLNDWTPTWADTREEAKLFDRFEIGLLSDAGLKNSNCFRGEWADTKAPDGAVAIGRRKVSKRGTIRFFKCVWTHEKLKTIIGKHVFVQPNEYWCTRVECFYPSYNPDEPMFCELEPIGVKTLSKREGR